MNDIATNKLSIYLIKEYNNNHKDIFRNFDKLKKEEIKHRNEKIGTLYYDNSNIFEPSWIKKFFGENFNNKKQDINQEEKNKIKLFNAGSKSILLVENQNRIFAIPFGYGWTLLEPGVFEERFGLKITLNTIDINNIRNIDKKNMSAVPKDTREQLSHAGVPSDFGIDIEQDMIQSLTGKSKDNNFGKSITGKDALSVSVKVDLSNIKEFLNKCYKKYLSTDYKGSF